jgi:cyclophilin family peptidyl-prolyl cis-trans isomerase
MPVVVRALRLKLPAPAQVGASGHALRGPGGGRYLGAVGTQKRKRKQTGRQSRQAAIVARQRASQRNRKVAAAVLVGILILGVAALVSTGGDDGDETVSAGATTIPTTVTSVATTAAGAVPPECPAPDGSSPRTASFTSAPPMCIDPAKTYAADIKTNKGSITVALDTKQAPKTANNFVFLARHHFYDGLGFHRIVPGFVIQGGDPAGNGSGGPGYKFEDELPAPGQYKEGALAMANSGPSTNGSQFFIVTGQTASTLPPNYSLFGQVTTGLDVVKAIEALGTPQGAAPSQPVTIESVTIKES